jgi:hypothetical protein
MVCVVVTVLCSTCAAYPGCALQRMLCTALCMQRGRTHGTNPVHVGPVTGKVCVCFAEGSELSVSGPIHAWCYHAVLARQGYGCEAEPGQQKSSSSSSS